MPDNVAETPYGIPKHFDLWEIVGLSVLRWDYLKFGVAYLFHLYQFLTTKKIKINEAKQFKYLYTNPVPRF